MKNEYQSPHDMGVNEIYREIDFLTTETIKQMARLAILRAELEARHGKRT